MLLFGYILVTGCSGFCADMNVFVNTSFYHLARPFLFFQCCSRLGLTWLIGSLISFIFVLT